MLVNGVWQKNWDPVQKKDAQGRFIRQDSVFRERIKDPVKIVKEGLRLYVGYICPWATRTLIARSLLGLEEQIEVKVVEPVLTDFGWKFGDFQGATSSAITDVEFAHQLYTLTDPDYSGRATVPVLWNLSKSRIMNNESSDILRVLNEDLRPIHKSNIDLYPSALQTKIDAFNDRIYHSFNNGVYRAGFASSQLAYDEAFADVFNCLDELEVHFEQANYAVGEQITESDIRLFVTLVRFDPAYFSLFKTNLRRISDYPNLSAYLDRLLSIKAFSENTRVDHIKAGYYSVKALNPSGIVPKGPELPWFKYLEAGQFQTEKPAEELA